VNPIVVTVGPLAGASATNIAPVQTLAAANALAMTGALTSGSSANNIALSQTVTGATTVVLNGSLVQSGVAVIGYASPIQIISAANDSAVNFTIVGYTYGTGPFAGPISVTEVVKGTNASRVASRNSFYSIVSITTSGSTTGNITVGTSGNVATMDFPRRVLLTFGTSDTTNTYTITGTDWNNMPVTEALAGGATTAQSLTDFKTVTSILPTNTPAGTVSAGTSGVGSSRPIWLDRFANAPTALEVDATGTVNYTVQQSLNDPNSVGFTSVNWVNHPDTNLVAATGTVQGNYAYVPTITRIVLNSGSGSVKYTVLQASNAAGSQ
jgi:hypothetical protein